MTYRKNTIAWTRRKFKLNFLLVGFICLFIFGDNNLLALDWFQIDKPNLINNGTGYSTYDQSISVKSDINGNIYHTGYFEGIIVFGEDTLVSNGSRDIFVCKIDKEGNYVWAISAGGSLTDFSKDLAINSNGEVFVTGYFFGSANFGSNQITAFKNADVFVAKTDSLGNWLWAINANGEGFDRANSIVADNNYCFISGNYEYNASFGNTNLSSIGSKDIFVAKIGTNGNWIWAKSSGGASSDDSYNINLDNNGNYLIISGYFSSTATFGSTNITSAGSRDPYVAKIDNSGTWGWVRRIGSSSSEEITSSYIDNNNNIYVGGFYSQSFSIDTAILNAPSGKDVWIAKLNSNGNWIWAKTLNGSGDDNIYSITGKDEFIYLSGGFEKTLSFASSSISTNSTNGRNGFYSKIDKNANLHYFKSIIGTPNVDPFSITINNIGLPIIVGTFYDNIFLSGDTVSSKGDSDIFLLKADSSGNITDYKINYGVRGLVKLLASEVDKNKNLILSGYFYGIVNFGKDTIKSVGGKDIFYSKYSLDSGFIWTKSIGSKLDDEFGAIAIDSSNNLYFGGNFSGTFKIQNQSISNNGLKDILILKTDNYGNIIYYKNYGGIYEDDCNSIAIFSSNFAITGIFNEVVDFSGKSLTSETYDDIYVLSFNQNGNINWAIKAGGTYFDVANKIISSSNNNLYLGGSFEDAASFGNINLTAVGGDDMFIAKINSAGTWVWAKSFGSDYYIESIKSLAIDNSNNIYFAGNYKDLIEIDSEFVLNNGGNDILLGKISDAGNWIWKKGFGGQFSELPFSLLIRDSKLYLTSTYQNSIKVLNNTYENDGNSSSLITIFDLNGNILNSYSESISYNSQPINVHFLKNDNFVLSGNYHYNIGFGNITKKEKWFPDENFYLAFYGIEPIANKWNVITNTGRSSQIILPKSINPKINSQPLTVGDAVGVFYTRNSNHYCAGYGIWKNEDLNITVWGDNLNTLVKDGIADNESYIIKTWKESTGVEIITDVRYSSGPSSFSENTESIISKFPFFYDSLSINLTAGWNLISSNVRPYNLLIDSIFKNYINDILIVKNSVGQTYIPSYEINTIGNWNIHHGYQVYALQNKTINILGEYITPENESINLPSGWSFLSYLRRNPMNIEDALASIISKERLLIAKTINGQTYIPSYDINTIGNMISGKGYQVYFLAKDTLIYPSNSLSRNFVNDYSDYSPKSLNKVEYNNPNNSTIIIQANSKYDNYEIYIHNINKNLIGSGRIVDGMSVITIFGNEETANLNNLINEGESFNIQIFDENGELYQEILQPNFKTISNSNSSTYKNNEIYKINLIDELDFDFVISPNPSSNIITINSNIIGNKINYDIFDLNNKKIKSGSGKSIKINDLTNGSYYLKIEYNGNYYSRKFIKVD